MGAKKEKEREFNQDTVRRDASPRNDVDDMPTKERSAAFLVEEFEMPADDAAELLSDDPDEAAEIQAHEYERQHKDNPLDGVPSPRDYSFEAQDRVHNHMHKEVIPVRKK